MLLALVLGPALLLQNGEPDNAFFRPRDGRLALAAAAGTAALAAFDERIARWTRQPRVQGDSTRHDRVRTVTIVNELPLTVGAIAVFVTGRLAGWETVADVGWHVTESLLATELAAEVIRVATGRARPRASPDDAFVFEPGTGLTRFENRSFPSLHAAVAFTTAAALVEEIRLRNPGTIRFGAPVLYTLAMVPGLTRVYLDQHWASDVFAGAFLGAFLGSRVVRYSHGRQTRLDRVMLGLQFVPSEGGLRAGWSLAH